MHITILGDSIFDNGKYVADGSSVTDLLRAQLPDATITLLAKDGSVASEVMKQLDRIPPNTTHTLLSCGGNDALRAQLRFDATVDSMTAALDILSDVIENFVVQYGALVDAITKINAQLIICTVYNHVPGIPKRSLTALRLFNDVITEECVKRNIPVVDLRSVCRDASDFCPASPIEPSASGGKKIVTAIACAINSKLTLGSGSVIHV